MNFHHNRQIKIKKKELITKLRENKEKHIKDYNEAVVAYKKKAQEELVKSQKRLNEGALDIKIVLVTPVNKSEEYDKIIEMFNWEVEELISLSQGEFNEYIHDESDFSKASFLANSTYK